MIQAIIRNPDQVLRRLRRERPVLPYNLHRARGVHPMGGNEAEIFILAILEGKFPF